jgi:hypothetical protein
MNNKPKTYSFLSGRFVITASAFHRLNLIDIYVATLRHACGGGVAFCLLDEPGEEPSFQARNWHATAHHDRHGTEFWILTEGDLSRTTIRLAAEG